MPPALALAGVASGHAHRTDERATFAAVLAAGLLAVAESECRRIELGSSDTHSVCGHRVALRVSACVS